MYAKMAGRSYLQRCDFVLVAQFVSPFWSLFCSFLLTFMVTFMLTLCSLSAQA
jgi:hypothetical protein